MSARGEAGSRAEDVRSDAWVAVEPRRDGGLEIDLTSKVLGMYGDRIRALLTTAAAALGLAHARLEVDDRGALDWVLAARLEAAARRADPSLDRTWLPPARTLSADGPRRDRLRRSRLYLPGNQPKLMLNAALHRPDGLILDLEDAVAPAEKDAARVLVRNALRCLDFGGAERMVRINQGERGLEDLAWTVPHGVDVVLIPKVEDPAQVRAVAERIAALDAPHDVLLMPIVESALGAWRAFEIASAHPSVCAVAIGLEDYTADLGVPRTLEGRESFWARCQVINGAVAAGVQPIDTVFSDVADEDGLRASVAEAKALGFVGKGCIHPRQIAPVHHAFAPTAAEIAKARDIVLAFEDAESRGLGVVSLGSKMIDAPVVKRAMTTVRTAVELGLLREGWRRGPVGNCGLEELD
ncbi:MAG TPA: aldolase/citrate lyase family protein [Candidatus Krumholzibacteria bacterium]|nr:aldolase/citrate lyase family protein [Candidatus Krumholzibacteria bacterium]HRX49931.1 aldolase/citrate lyase family protein [Candidatus Krumholzibacteria bacterium]